MEYQSFDNSEDELLYFVRSLNNKTWTWAHQYQSDESEASEDEEHRTIHTTHTHLPYIAECRFDAIIFISISISNVIAEWFLANCADKESHKMSHYYCNQELVELLIFDARVTNTSYGTWEFESKEAENLITKYNATLRFVATMSGLTRWQFIFGETEVEGDK